MPPAVSTVSVETLRAPLRKLAELNAQTSRLLAMSVADLHSNDIEGAPLISNPASSSPVRKFLNIGQQTTRLMAMSVHGYEDIEEGSDTHSSSECPSAAPSPLRRLRDIGDQTTRLLAMSVQGCDDDDLDSNDLKSLSNNTHRHNRWNTTNQINSQLTDKTAYQTDILISDVDTSPYLSLVDDVKLNGGIDSDSEIGEFTRRYYVSLVGGNQHEMLCESLRFFPSSGFPHSHTSFILCFLSG